MRRGEFGRIGRQGQGGVAGGLLGLGGHNLGRLSFRRRRFRGGFGLQRGAVQEERKVLLGPLERLRRLVGCPGAFIRLHHDFQEGDGLLGASRLGVLSSPVEHVLGLEIQILLGRRRDCRGGWRLIFRGHHRVGIVDEHFVEDPAEDSDASGDQRAHDQSTALASLIRVEGRGLLDEYFLFGALARGRLLALLGFRRPGPVANLGGSGRFRWLTAPPLPAFSSLRRPLSVLPLRPHPVRSSRDEARAAPA